MSRLNELTTYSASMRAFHWCMAIIILAMLALGTYMTPYQDDPLWDQYYYWHKSCGVLLFMLVIARLVNRRFSRVPALPATLPELDKKLAKIAHVLFYILMFLVPLLGYLMSSSFEYSDGVYFFSFFELPELFPKSEWAFNVFQKAHAIAAYSLLALIVLHVLGVVKHRYMDSTKENDVLSRML